MRNALTLLLLFFLPGVAAASNLNTTSNLSDAGVAPPAASLRLVTPNILDGVPLMQGLQLKTDPALVEILPDARKNPVVAVGVVDVDDVYNFYKLALPDLGWQAQGPRDYMRNAAYLHINAQADGKNTTVTFTETP